jgi:hypothetical protein
MPELRPRIARRARPPSDAEPADHQHGDWTRERLLKMDARFVERMQRAIAKGRENRELATAVGAREQGRARAR